ncbi:phage antirepressor KilAC domain-containing protein [Pseudomonas mandelii]|uniref:phage antirepressor KilAC domain-containing protein n=1 Tax=Pseudomonas mandelii TaxID=75612 RepID=UPI00224B4105|nr:phage antirepressor KilAC domain-containing protein [Pseudomonas mandelii]MCX2899013.1 phage antirepressor KilAC domain-containing protein [Pseudomonas mandelii]
MSSLEIAELTGKDHAHILRDIRVVLDEIKDDPNLDHVKISTDSRGYSSEIRLPRDLTETLITGYNIALRHKVVVLQLLTGVATQSPQQSERLTMSSQEIAQLTGKRHDHVVRDIRTMLGLLNFAAPQIWGTAFIPGRNNSRREVEVANLPRDLTETLITGYSAPLRLAVIRRLHELEAEVAKPPALALPNFSNPAEAARAWASEFEGRTLALEVVKERDQKIAQDASKVEYYQKVRSAVNTESIGDFAKKLEYGEKKLFKWMRESEILMTDNKPYQKHLDAGHFRVLDKATTKADGKKITYTQTVLTGKGKQYIQKHLKKAGSPDLSE